MDSSEWLRSHREEIVRRWKERVRPISDSSGGTRWEQRVDESFDHICVLMAGDALDVGEPDVESKLFQCAVIGRDAKHQFSARLLAGARQAIGEVSDAGEDVEARQCADECGNAIDYLQHMLRVNVCHDCKEINCCMRVESFKPMPGGMNE